MEGLPGWVFSPIPGPPPRQNKHERQYTPSTHSVIPTRRIWNDDDDGQMIFGEPWGPKVSWHLSYRWGKTPKNPHQETCPDRGSNPGPLRDKRACSTAVDLILHNLPKLNVQASFTENDWCTNDTRNKPIENLITIILHKLCSLCQLSAANKVIKDLITIILGELFSLYQTRSALENGKLWCHIIK